MKKLKRKITNKLLKHLLCTITEEDVLKIDRKNEQFIVGKRVLPENDKKQMISEAKSIKNMLLWKYLRKNIRFRANYELFNRAKDYEDMIAGKMSLYTIQLIEEIVNNVKNPFPKRKKGDKN
ncbi:hypothetical protein GF319_15485 [Candidatus Bathyarchaeota archaeon]|nr:hypothetical protein [Candidatus Bathyarchaeota archaeon]